MALDRWIALIILGICLIYGYAAWFTMDGDLPPFMRRNPVWPSSFPKALSVLCAITALIVLFGLEKSEKTEPGDIDYRRLHEYNLGQAILLLVLMVVYAVSLRPLGFIASTAGFLLLGSYILGERRWITMLIVSFTATLLVWYLVDEVLGIFLRPLPQFMGNF